LRAFYFSLLRPYASNELIGGGFGFSNPNAETTCGCGKSFNV
jgi:iron-sulfur cluster assembly protein